MATQQDSPEDGGSLWREAAIVLRFVAEAALVSGGIVLLAWWLA
jgi:hypothetical protein